MEEEERRAMASRFGGEDLKRTTREKGFKLL